MNPNNISPEMIELFRLQEQVHQWMDSLIASGIEENSVLSALHLTLVERVITRFSVDETLTWLRGMVSEVELHGGDMKVAWTERKG
jgi:hypothetical protein